MSHVRGEASFRFPLAWQCFYPLCALCLTYGLPESPRTLYYLGHIEEGDEVLRRLHAASSVDDNVVSAEKSSILESINSEKITTSGESLWQAVFHDKSPVRNSYRVLIIVILQGLQQLGKSRYDILACPCGMNTDPPSQGGAMLSHIIKRPCFGSLWDSVITCQGLLLGVLQSVSWLAHFQPYILSRKWDAGSSCFSVQPDVSWQCFLSPSCWLLVMAMLG